MSKQQTELKPDIELLEMMLEDHNHVDPKWQATSYWQDIAVPLVEYFRNSVNLINFRCAPIRTGIRSVLPSNPGRKPSLTGRGAFVAGILKKIPLIGKVVKHQQELIDMSVGEHDSDFRHSLDLSYLLNKEIDPEKDVLEDKLVGNPDDVVQIGGRNYSYRLLGYQYLYCQAMKHMGNRQVGSVLELGSGYGGQAEVFLRKNVHIKYVAMDIPPWLYVAEVYLKALFPGQVLGYRETRKIDKPANLLDLMKSSRIAMVPAWKWPQLSDQFDLFWNSKSLQEMNESTSHYIDRAVGSCGHLFLHAYSTSKKGVHSPEYLREKIAASPLVKELMWEEDLYAGLNSMSAMFEKKSG